MRGSKIYIAVVSIIFTGVAVVFWTFPRSGYSELEKRELKRLPAFTVEKLLSGAYTSEVSAWRNC